MIMEQLHAHEVLHMMEGNSYSESSQRKAIVDKFGECQHFYACSADDMNVDELIEFLKKKGKFMPVRDGFTVDVSKVCSHETGKQIFIGGTVHYLKCAPKVLCGSIHNFV